MAYDASKEKRTQLKSFRKNGHGDFIVINDIETEGRNPSLDIRTMYTDDNEELRPTTKGLRFSKALIPDLAAMFVKDMDDEQLSDLTSRVNLIPTKYESVDEFISAHAGETVADEDDEMPEFAPATNPKNVSVHLKAFKKNERGDYIVVSRIDSDTYETAIDIRTMYTDNDGLLRPTTKGVRFGVSCIPDLVEGLVKGMDDAGLEAMALKCENVIEVYKDIE